MNDPATRPSPIDAATHGSPERPARQLDPPLLRLDLAAEIAALRAERQYAEGDRNARTLAKSSWFRLTLVALRADAAFEEADQRGVVAIQVLEGGLRLEVDGQEHAQEVGQLAVGQLAVVGAGHPWQARSVGEAVVLIQLSWPPEPGDAG